MGLLLLHQINNNSSNNHQILLILHQRTAYDAIIERVSSGAPETFFLDAPGGIGKTFTINLLLSKIRLQ
eukprot:46552-Hanusia_phi.AAC.1